MEIKVRSATGMDMEMEYATQRTRRWHGHVSECMGSTGTMRGALDGRLYPSQVHMGVCAQSIGMGECFWFTLYGIEDSAKCLWNLSKPFWIPDTQIHTSLAPGHMKHEKRINSTLLFRKTFHLNVSCTFRFRFRPLGVPLWTVDAPRW
jgi:hypothetical protein